MGKEGLQVVLTGREWYEVGMLSVRGEELSILVKEWGSGQTDELIGAFLETLALKRAK